MRPFFWGRDLTGTVPGEFSLVRCEICSLSLLWPIPDKRQVFSFYPDDYYQFGAKQRAKIIRRAMRVSHSWRSILPKRNYSFLGHTRLGCLLKVDLPYSPVFPFSEIVEGIDNRRILDIGCGTGEFLLAMKNMGWETWGVEPNLVAATVAKSLGLRVFHGELNEASLPAGYFQVIRLHHVLEHIYNPVETMREIHRLLSKEGRLIVTVPNIGGMGFKIFGRFWWGLDLPRHIFHYSPGSLSTLAEETGFRIVRIFHHGSKSILVRSLSLAISRKKSWQRIVRRLPPVQLVGNILQWLGKISRRSEEFTAFLRRLPLPETVGQSGSDR
ncbi:MAG: class I SAM-dependent methyltransferase [Candidatus Omnitrophica bacterium]|nr:class I SAM-dependent methyltransferase [Candidatus Omnitrophota bacterium]